MRKVIALMQEHYNRDLTLGKLADSVHLSVWHLCHLFKTETGKPPAQFLKSIRMEEARRLLESTLLSVKEVVNKVGMNDQSHFVKDFKKVYGHTPTKYRCASSRMSAGTRIGGAVEADFNHPEDNGSQSGRLRRNE
ncbi:MAG TPA: AraC family transcriptional regulator [Pyrinomonadaceae bacterium]|nr:AraC family transcriptional regulator [Pyrinomonadaceae bacterium]